MNDDANNHHDDRGDASGDAGGDGGWGDSELATLILNPPINFGGGIERGCVRGGDAILRGVAGLEAASGREWRF